MTTALVIGPVDSEVVLMKLLNVALPSRSLPFRMDRFRALLAVVGQRLFRGSTLMRRRYRWPGSRDRISPHPKLYLHTFRHFD